MRLDDYIGVSRFRLYVIGLAYPFPISEVLAAELVQQGFISRSRVSLFYCGEIHGLNSAIVSRSPDGSMDSRDTGLPMEWAWMILILPSSTPRKNITWPFL